MAENIWKTRGLRGYPSCHPCGGQLHPLFHFNCRQSPSLRRSSLSHPVIPPLKLPYLAHQYYQCQWPGALQFGEYEEHQDALAILYNGKI